MSSLFFLGCNFKFKVFNSTSAIKYIKENARYWQRDSIGEIGWRSEIYAVIEHYYSFKGVNWDDVKDSFGLANREYTSYVKDGKANYLDVYLYHLVAQRTTKTVFIYGWDIEIKVNPVTHKIYEIRKIGLGP